MPETVSPEEQKNTGEWQAPEAGKDQYSGMLAEAKGETKPAVEVDLTDEGLQRILDEDEAATAREAAEAAEPGLFRRALNKIRGKKADGPEVGDDGLTTDEWLAQKNAHDATERAEAHQAGNEVETPSKLEINSVGGKHAERAGDVVDSEFAALQELVGLGVKVNVGNDAHAMADRAERFLEVETKTYLPGQLKRINEPDYDERFGDPIEERRRAASQAGMLVAGMSQAISQEQGFVKVGESGPTDIDSHNAVELHGLPRAEDAVALATATELVRTVTGEASGEKTVMSGFFSDAESRAINNLKKEAIDGKKAATFRVKLGLGTELVLIAVPARVEPGKEPDVNYSAFVVADMSARSDELNAALGREQQDSQAAAAERAQQRPGESDAEHRARVSKAKNRVW